MRHYLEDESDEKSQSNVCRLAASSNQANRRRKIAAEDYFNSAPMEGAHNYTLKDSVFKSNPPWHSLSLFCPWHDHDNGKFNMLDYMLLYNLYQLTYKSELPEFKYLWNQNNNSN